MGGIKVGRSGASLPLRVQVERLRPPEDFLHSLEQHLLLVYTGKTRLARNLLQVCPVRPRPDGRIKMNSSPLVHIVPCTLDNGSAFVRRMWFVAGTVVCRPSFRMLTTWWRTLKNVPKPVQKVRRLRKR